MKHPRRKSSEKKTMENDEIQLERKTILPMDGQQVVETIIWMAQPVDALAIIFRPSFVAWTFGFYREVLNLIISPRPVVYFAPWMELVLELLELLVVSCVKSMKVMVGSGSLLFAGWSVVVAWFKLVDDADGVIAACWANWFGGCMLTV